MDTLLNNNGMSATLSLNFPDTKEFLKQFDAMTSMQIYRIHQEALKKAFKPTLVASKENVKANDKNTAPSMVYPKQGDPFERKSLFDALAIIPGAIRLKHLSVRIVARRKKPFLAYHAHLFEYGTQPRKTKKGANRGKINSVLFMHKALDSTGEQVQNNAMNEINNSIARFWEKHTLN